MIRVKYGDQTRIATDLIDPEQLFDTFLRHGLSWEVDYSQATVEEAFRWFKWDLVFRCIRALAKGLPVKFLDKEYRFTGMHEENMKIVGQLEDDIVYSGRMITLTSDDENGVVIGVGGYEYH
jgi:hypothetical protein